MRALLWIAFGVVVLGLAGLGAIAASGRAIAAEAVAPAFAVLLWMGLALLALGLAGLARPKRKAR